MRTITGQDRKPNTFLLDRRAILYTIRTYFSLTDVSVPYPVSNDTKLKFVLIRTLTYKTTNKMTDLMLLPPC
jgi:hypothetical protein